MTFPDAFAGRLVEILGEEAAASALAHMRERQRPCYRVNTLKARVDDVRAELEREGVASEPLPFVAEAFVARREDRERLTHSAAADEGRIYIQNAASLVPVLLLDPRPGERVLDLAAAPGGKTLFIAARMGGEGELSAVEKVKPRFFKLKDNLRRHGAGFVRTFLMDGALVAKKTPERFDRVLLDAPCSSEARFLASDPETFSKWSERKIGEMVKKQTRLLGAAIAASRPGGVIVYSTCSFAPEENEGVVDAALSRFQGVVELEPIELSLPNGRPGLTRFRERAFSAELTKTLRLLPDDVMHGFFVAKLRKRS